MISRIYIHNYRCFENLDISFDGQSSVLILGKNGSGKSSFKNALRILQQIAQGSNRIRQFLSRDDFGSERISVPIRIELSVTLQSVRYDYSIAFEWPEDFKEARVQSESLHAAGHVVFARKEAQVELAAANTSFLVDWHVAALPIVQLKGENPIEKFRYWLSRTVLIAPIPAMIASESNQDLLLPNKNVTNFADWFSGILSEYPASYSTIEQFLKKTMPDFLDFQNKAVGESTKKIYVRFESGDKIISLSLDRLSDGEKVFFVCAVLLAANKHFGPTFCFWDEPSNYVSLSESGQMTAELRKSFKQSGQLFVTSHNPEAIRKFSDESTLVLERKSHLEPTTARWLNDLSYPGDLINSLIRGDIGNGE